jgi:hypothetical protein
MIHTNYINDNDNNNHWIGLEKHNQKQKQKQLTFLCEQQQAFDDLGSESPLGLHQFCFPYTLHKPENPTQILREKKK